MLNRRQLRFLEVAGYHLGTAALLAGNQGSPETVKARVALANALDQTTTLPIAGFLAAASLIILRSRSLPRWIG